MNLTDSILAITPLALVGVGGLLFFFGWTLGGPLSRPLYTLVTVTALAAFLSQVALGVGFARDNGLRTPSATLWSWSSVGDTGFGVTLAFRADLLAYLFALPLASLTLLTVLYLLVRRPQAEAQDGILGGRLYGLIFLAEGAGLAAFYSVDFVLIFFWLEAVGLALYLLSGPGLRGASAKPVSYRALGVNLLAGQLILAPLLVMISRNGGRSAYPDLIPAVLDSTLFALVVGGCLMKAAQFPFGAWLGSFEDLPGAAYGLLSAGFVFPFAVYLPVRLVALAGDRFDLLGGAAWLLLPVGALTILFSTVMALRRTAQPLTTRIGFLTAAQFGFVTLALGLNDLTAAFQSLVALIVGAPLLFLCADQLAIENAPPPNPGNRAIPKPLGRPPLFRALLTGAYLVGAFNYAGLPLSPSYAARWQILGELLGNGQRFYTALALVGLVLGLLALVQGLVLFLNGPRRTADAHGQEGFWAVGGILGLAGLSLGLGFYPGLASGPLGQAVGRVRPGENPIVPGSAAQGWLGLLVAVGLLVGLGLFWLGRRTHVYAPYNGGLNYGPEAQDERPQFARTGRSKMALKLREPEVEIPEGFEDEFFSSAFRKNPRPVGAPRRPLPDPRLGTADYLGPLDQRLREVYQLLDTGYGGNFFGTLALRLLDRLRRVFEWMVERFYPALAAFILLVFIILLTR